MSAKARALEREELEALRSTLAINALKEEEKNMDPRTTLDTARADLNANRPRTALESILNYYNWRVFGGFAPYNGDNMARDLAVRIQDALMNEHKEPGEDAPTSQAPQKDTRKSRCCLPWLYAGGD